MGLHSLSLLGNKSSTNLKALPMSLSVVYHVAEPTKHGVPTMSIIATLHGIKFSTYLHPVSPIDQSILRKAGSFNTRRVLSAL